MHIFIHCCPRNVRSWVHQDEQLVELILSSVPLNDCRRKGLNEIMWLAELQSNCVKLCRKHVRNMAFMFVSWRKVTSVCDFMFLHGFPQALWIPLIIRLTGNTKSPICKCECLPVFCLMLGLAPDPLWPLKNNFFGQWIWIWRFVSSINLKNFTTSSVLHTDQDSASCPWTLQCSKESGEPGVDSVSVLH